MGGAEAAAAAAAAAATSEGRLAPSCLAPPGPPVFSCFRFPPSPHPVWSARPHAHRELNLAPPSARSPGALIRSHKAHVPASVREWSSDAT
eukprot:5129264-Prymnesium_polylepis.1